MQTNVGLDADHLLKVDRIDLADVEQVILRRQTVERIRIRHVLNHCINGVRVFLWAHDTEVDPLCFSVHDFQVFRLGPLEVTIAKIDAHLLLSFFRWEIYEKI